MKKINIRKNVDVLALRLLSKNPVSRVFGFDRGLPIDRYYIERFLEENKNIIKGKVLEVAESSYTEKFGGSNVEESLILHVAQENSKADIIANLETGEGIIENLVDCFIFTQTLPFIYNLKNAVTNSIRLLKYGGYLLLTVPGISQISRYDMERWGHYWSFTNLSLRKLFEEIVSEDNISIKTYGNVKSATCFLFGLSCNELSKKDLDYFDPDYQVIISAVIKKL